MVLSVLAILLAPSDRRPSTQELMGSTKSIADHIVERLLVISCVEKGMNVFALPQRVEENFLLPVIDVYMKYLPESLKTSLEFGGTCFTYDYLLKLP